jgi:4-amino-4-deoxy-L-arabinose transferase-like glycosyltransferase
MYFPSNGGFIFDEIHYVKASRILLTGVSANNEHPPLVKIIVMYSMQLFGDNWFAWRFPIIIFSLVGTYYFYKVAEIWMDKKYALISTLFLLSDVIFFIHGNIYMLEIPSITFLFIFIYYYLKGKYNISSVFMALSFLCNEKSLLILFGVIIYHLSINYDISDRKKHNNISYFITSLIIMAIIGASGLFILDSIWKPYSMVYIINNVKTYEYITNPISHLLFMFGYFRGIQNSIVNVVSDNPPLSWILPLTSGWNNPPVYYRTVNDGITYINYVGFPSYPIWWMTIPIILFCLFYYKELFSKFILCMIIPFMSFWFYWDSGVGFISYPHYFLMGIPFMCLAIPIFWKKIYSNHGDMLIVIHLLISIIFFISMFPIKSF